MVTEEKSFVARSLSPQFSSTAGLSARRQETMKDPPNKIAELEELFKHRLDAADAGSYSFFFFNLERSFELIRILNVGAAAEFL